MAETIVSLQEKLSALNSCKEQIAQGMKLVVEAMDTVYRITSDPKAATASIKITEQLLPTYTGNVTGHIAKTNDAIKGIEEEKKNAEKEARKAKLAADKRIEEGDCVIFERESKEQTGIVTGGVSFGKIEYLLVTLSNGDEKKVARGKCRLASVAEEQAAAPAETAKPTPAGKTETAADTGKRSPTAADKGKTVSFKINRHGYKEGKLVSVDEKTKKAKIAYGKGEFTRDISEVYLSHLKDTKTAAAADTPAAKPIPVPSADRKIPETAKTKTTTVKPVEQALGLLADMSEDERRSFFHLVGIRHTNEQTADYADSLMQGIAVRSGVNLQEVKELILS